MLVVTSFHIRQWETQAKKMVQSFLRHWPDDITLRIWLEGGSPPISDPQLDWRRLETVSEWSAYIQRWGGQRKDNHILNDPEKWSAKVYALTEDLPEKGWYLWLDADTKTRQNVTHVDISRWLPKGKNLVFLGREWLHPKDCETALAETGFVGYRMDEPKVRELLLAQREMWTSGSVMNLPWQADGYAFNVIRNRIRPPGQFDLTEGMGPSKIQTQYHPWPYTIIGKHMVHFKGPKRKVDPRTRQPTDTPSRRVN